MAESGVQAHRGSLGEVLPACDSRRCPGIRWSAAARALVRLASAAGRERVLLMADTPARILGFGSPSRLTHAIQCEPRASCEFRSACAAIAVVKLANYIRFTSL